MALFLLKHHEETLLVIRKNVNNSKNWELLVLFFLQKHRQIGQALNKLTTQAYKSLFIWNWLIFLR